MSEMLPRQAERLQIPEEGISPEVKRAVTEIDEIEQAIAAKTGFDGQELINTTDDFLADSAERASEDRALDSARLIETALIEGALEKVGKRPISTHNPIVKLEVEGYNKQVTDGVQRLHEAHVTLPNGESAAEVVAQTVAALEEHRSVESPIIPDSKSLDAGAGEVFNIYAEKSATVIGLNNNEVSEDSSRILSDQEVESLGSTVESHEGYWFEVQQERMASPDFKEKFRRFIEKHKSSLKEGEPSSAFDKLKSFQSHYTRQLDEFDDNLSRIGSSVSYGTASETGGKSASSLGHGSIGEPGTVYRDAIHNGTLLTGSQKDIIAAHEAYHGMVDAQGSAAIEIRSGFDWDVYRAQDVKQPMYLRNPDELTARMAQFKNYFGMRGSEQFTPDHLNYLRQHYIEDTGLDNAVSTMLSIITPTTEGRFIKLMNELPI